MYDYKEEKQYVFTDKGQRHFLFIRDLVHRFLKESGAFQMSNAMKLGPTGAATNWEMMACVDRLVEIGEIKEIKQDDLPYRIFIKDKIG